MIGGLEHKWLDWTYEEYRLGFPAAGVRVLLPQRDELFGEPLGFFGFVPGCGDGFVDEEGGDKIAKEGLSVGGFSAEMTVFQRSARHVGGGGREGAISDPLEAFGSAGRHVVVWGLFLQSAYYCVFVGERSRSGVVRVFFYISKDILRGLWSSSWQLMNETKHIEVELSITPCAPRFRSGQSKGVLDAISFRQTTSTK